MKYKITTLVLFFGLICIGQNDSIVKDFISSAVEKGYYEIHVDSVKKDQRAKISKALISALRESVLTGKEARIRQPDIVVNSELLLKELNHICSSDNESKPFNTPTTPLTNVELNAEIFFNGNEDLKEVFISTKNKNKYPSVLNSKMKPSAPFKSDTTYLLILTKDTDGVYHFFLNWN